MKGLQTYYKYTYIFIYGYNFFRFNAYGYWCFVSNTKCFTVDRYIAAENLNHIKRKTKKKLNNEKLNRISYAVLRVPPVIKYKPKGE